jgi:hypothetical protein
MYGSAAVSKAYSNAASNLALSHLDLEPNLLPSRRAKPLAAELKRLAEMIQRETRV